MIFKLTIMSEIWEILYTVYFGLNFILSRWIRIEIMIGKGDNIPAIRYKIKMPYFSMGNNKRYVCQVCNNTIDYYKTTYPVYGKIFGKQFSIPGDKW